MLLFLSVATAAPTHDPAQLREQLQERFDQRVDERLDARLEAVSATPEQRERIEGLTDEWREKRETFREEGRGLRENLRELLLAESIDRKAIEHVREEMVDLFDRSTSFALGQLVRAAEILTPEQRATLRSHLAGQ